MTKDSFSILFVCSGNSCRSPMAEGLMKAKIPQQFKDKVRVKSAGTLGIERNPATEFAVTVAGELGADISGHRSQGITEEILKDSDIIFAMSSEHKEYLQTCFPEIRENVFLLRSFGRNPEEKYPDSIEDPIGRSLEVYQECGRLIDTELDRILPRLEKLIAEKIRSEEA